jgi:hypothetical protein
MSGTPGDSEEKHLPGFHAPGSVVVIDAESIALAAGATVFAKAFLETLGQRAGNGAAGLPRRVADLVSRHIKRKGRPEEIHISAEGDVTASIIVTSKTPDEARLALLDLDVTAENVRGKTLRWDSNAMAWRASSAEEQQKPSHSE